MRAEDQNNSGSHEHPPSCSVREIVTYLVQKKTMIPKLVNYDELNQCLTRKIHRRVLLQLLLNFSKGTESSADSDHVRMPCDEMLVL